MKTQFNTKHLTLAILSVLLPAANGNAAGTAGVIGSAVGTGPKTSTTRLVSVNLAGTGSGNNLSLGSVLSANGQFVAFLSAASNLVANDTNGDFDIFVRDLRTGTTTLASVNLAGTTSVNSFFDSNPPRAER